MDDDSLVARRTRTRRRAVRVVLWSVAAIFVSMILHMLTSPWFGPGKDTGPWLWVATFALIAGVVGVPVAIVAAVREVKARRAHREADFEI